MSYLITLSSCRAVPILQKGSSAYSPSCLGSGSSFRTKKILPLQWVLHIKPWRMNGLPIRFNSRSRILRINSMEEDAGDMLSFDSGSDSGEMSSGFSSGAEEEVEQEINISSAGGIDFIRTEESQSEATMKGLLSPIYDVPSFPTNEQARFGPGVLITVALSFLIVMLLLLVDLHIWQIIRRPLAPFFLTFPFLASAIISGCLGCFCVPLLRNSKFKQIFRKEGPTTHLTKMGTPTMGGLFFVPVGVAIARIMTGFSSTEVSGAVVATLAFAIIGFLDDSIALIRNHNYGLPGWIKLSLQVGLGTWFFFWMDSSNLQSPYQMKNLVPLPAPMGLLNLGNWYLPLTTFCFAAMANGINLTDGLDGLAGGTAAMAFIGMSIAVLPIYPDLAVFGISMAGASIGFLMHNRYKASIFMGDTGSLALGGALAAMAACSGMFLPLFIASGIFVIETISVMMQVSYFKITKWHHGTGHRLFRMAPIHHHFELSGVKEVHIIVSAYALSCALALFAAYVGLISA